jgi:hypothetical protein
LLAWVAVSVTGCTGWRQVPVTPAGLADSPTQVQVTRTDGTRITLTDPRIVADSLYGQGGRKEVVLPLNEVSRIAVQKPATAKNEAALTFVAAGLVAVLGWTAYAVIGQ